MQDDASSMPLCRRCWQALPWQGDLRCSRCDLPLAQEASWCRDCQREAPAFDRLHSIFRYQFPLDPLIHRFKNERHYHLAKALGRPLCEHIGKRWAAAPGEAAVDLIAPVPLHWWTHVRRGYNPSHLLAAVLGTGLGVPVRPILTKPALTRTQKSLSKAQRRRNLIGSFRCVGDVCGLHVALVDDVVTTGATADAAARALKRAGAREVSVWALARTPKH